MLRISLGRPARIVATVLILACTAAGATAATRHVLTLSQGSGSGGAVDYLQGTASGGALQGEVATSPDTGITVPFGLFGVYDPPGSTFGVGVLGVSTTGYAIAGESLSSQPTMLAYAGGGGIALEATTSSNSFAQAIYAEAKGGGDAMQSIADGSGDAVDAIARGGGDGIRASSMQNAAVEADTSGLEATILAYNSSSAGSTNGSYVGISALATSGNGIFAESENAVGAYITNQSKTKDTMVIDQPVSSSAYALFIENANNGLLAVNTNGNLYVRGTVTADASLQRTHNPNSTAMSYSAQTSQPVMEDFGTAQLVDGSATVALAADFRETIDGTSRYLVFMTPNGDTNGLYVATRTPSGFVVRETHGGRSSFSFDYRIVAQQYGQTGRRIPHDAGAMEDALGSGVARHAGGAPSAAILRRFRAGERRTPAPAPPIVGMPSATSIRSR